MFITSSNNSNNLLESFKFHEQCFQTIQTSQTKIKHMRTIQYEQRGEKYKQTQTRLIRSLL
jgi:hypothetical protein